MNVRLPAPPPEPPVDQSLTHCAPRFATRVLAVLDHMQSLGFDPMISESCRSDARQAWLYGFGREYDDGRGIVTQAPTGDTSWHKFGLAADIISKATEWNAPDAFWQALGLSARAEGLVWGGDWPRFTDRPHIQYGAPMRQAPSSEAAQLYAQGGNAAVWAAVGAA